MPAVVVNGRHRAILTRHESSGKIAGMNRVLCLLAIAVSGCASWEAYNARDCEHCPEMVVIPAGTAILGAGGDDKFSNADELPERTFTLREPFLVSRYEITLDQYEPSCAQPIEPSVETASRIAVSAAIGNTTRLRHFAIRASSKDATTRWRA